MQLEIGLGQNLEFTTLSKLGRIFSQLEEF
jgi:hypothetical protein